MCRCSVGELITKKIESKKIIEEKKKKRHLLTVGNLLLGTQVLAPLFSPSIDGKTSPPSGFYNVIPRCYVTQ